LSLESVNGGLGDTAYVEMVRLQDGRPGQLRYVMQCNPSGIPEDLVALKPPSEPEWPEQGTWKLDPIQLRDDSVKFIVPRAAGPGIGIFALRAVAKDGTCGPCVLLNRPEIWWCQSDFGMAGIAGQPIRAFGKNLRGVGGQVAIALVPVTDLDTEYPLSAEPVDDNSVRFSLPARMPAGEYLVFAHNGYGGAWGWSMPAKIVVCEPEEWSQQRYNVRDFGAAGTGEVDDTAAIRAALSQAAAAGGGVVYFPRGAYLVSDTLEVPRFTTWL